MRTGTSLRLRLKAAWYRRRYRRRLHLGRDVRIEGRLYLAPGARVHLGDRCEVRRAVRFDGPGEVRVGAGTLLNGTWIGCWTTMNIGAGGLIADCHLLDNDFHNVDPDLRHAPPADATRAPIHLGDNVWVGTGAWIFKGVRIGPDTVVGAATVVRSDVPSRSVVIGNPHQIVKHLPAGQWP